MRRNSMRRKGCERGPALSLMMLFAGKFGQEREKRAKCEHIAIIPANPVVIWGSRLRAHLRNEPKTTTNGGEKGEANPHSCGARHAEPVGSDCRFVGDCAAASSSRSACCCCNDPQNNPSYRLSLRRYLPSSLPRRPP